MHSGQVIVPFSIMASTLRPQEGQVQFKDFSEGPLLLLGEREFTTTSANVHGELFAEISDIPQGVITCLWGMVASWDTIRFLISGFLLIKDRRKSSEMYGYFPVKISAAVRIALRPVDNFSFVAPLWTSSM